MQPAELALAAVGGELSGRVGSVVFSRNTHGPYSYTWQSRTDPNTSAQSRTRGALTAAVGLWHAMPPWYRSTWDTYAASRTFRSRQAANTHRSGFNLFCAPLTFRWYTSLSGLIWAPTVLTVSRIGFLTYTPVGIGYALATFDLTDPWRTQNGGGIAIFQSRPQTANVNHFSGPFQFVAHSHGSSTTPPVATGINLTFPPVTGKRYIFFRARSIESDNRLSPPIVQRVYFP